jgi:hypothetical protein
MEREYTIACHLLGALGAGSLIVHPLVTAREDATLKPGNCFLTSPLREGPRCPFRKSCASIFWARQRVKSWACSPHVVLTLLHDKDLDHARASCMPGIPGS